MNFNFKQFLRELVYVILFIVILILLLIYILVELFNYSNKNNPNVLNGWTILAYALVLL